MYSITNIEIMDGRLEGKISLPIWKDFQSKQGHSTQGEFAISMGGDMVVDNPTMTTEHINAYEYITNHSQEVYNAILVRLFAEYKNLQTDYGYDEEEAKEIMPDIDNIEQFKDLIGLSQIHLLNVHKDNIAYVGYEFGCTWDNEHGLGFMTHKDRIIDFGGADTSFLTWVAEKDIEPQV